MTDTPTLGRPHEMPAIRNSDELCQRWRALMGPLGFGRPRLWIAFLGRDNMMSPQLTQIEDIPGRADAQMCGSLLEMCRHIVGRNGIGGSVAMLLTRPGRNPLDDCRSQLGTLPHLGSGATQGLDVAGAFRERRRAAGLRA
jgi:hypothetical protein